MGHPGILFRPLGFTTEAYRKVFSNSRIWIGYANTIFYVKGCAWAKDHYSIDYVYNVFFRGTNSAVFEYSTVRIV